jgi:gamma-glutamyltranspeptidase/glutathione hydrolase/leukotriene-C4 hydrolase
MDPRNALHPEKRTSINEGRRRRRRLLFRDMLLLFLILAVTPCGSRQFISNLLSDDADEVESSPKTPAFPIEAAHGAVASEHESCSKIGVEVLKDGGNAVDAAVATTFCIGVVNMFS